MSQLTVPIVSTDAATLSDCSALSWDRWFLSHRSECPNVPARRPRCCSAFGSFWIYLAASSRVTSWRPRGKGIDSSKRRCQPRSAKVVDGIAQAFHGEFDIVRLKVSPTFNFREVTVLREPLKVFRGDLLAVMRSLVNFSRMYGSRGMAPLKRESLPPASPQDSFAAMAGIGDLPGKDAPAGFSECPNAASVGLHLRILQQADGKACNAQHFPLNL